MYDEHTVLELGKSYVLREGDDVTLVAGGIEVAQALIAADQLAAEGISAEVIDVFSVKPFDKPTLLASIEKTGCVVTCEEHSTVGGLGSAVADIIGENHPVPLERVGVRDMFGTSGEPRRAACRVWPGRRWHRRQGTRGHRPQVTGASGTRGKMCHGV